MQSSGKPISYKCFNDCRQEGCPGHTVTCTYLFTSDVIRFTYDNGEEWHTDKSEFKALINAWESMLHD